jgi:hypothetical protein
VEGVFARHVAIGLDGDQAGLNGTERVLGRDPYLIA